MLKINIVFVQYDLVEFFSKIRRQIRRNEQKEFWQKWGSNPGYPDNVPSVLTIGIIELTMLEEGFYFMHK